MKRIPFCIFTFSRKLAFNFISFMTSRIKKWLIQPLLVLFSVTLLALAIAFLVATTQQERLVKIAIDEVNNQFKGELVVEGSSISLFEHFPYVSIALHNASFFNEKGGHQKPVYRFERVFAGFSVSDLIAKKYNIRQLALQGGSINLIRTKNGTINMMDGFAPQTTAPSSAQSSSSGSAEINLEKVFLEQVHVTYSDEQSGITTGSHIEKLITSLKMDSTQLFITLESEMELDVATTDNRALFTHKKLLIDLAANYNLHQEKANILSCHLKLEEAAFTLTGTADLSDTTNLDLRILGDNKDFKLVSAFLPDDLKEKTRMFSYDGRLHFDARIRGQVGEDKIPHVLVTFGCDNAWIHNDSGKAKVDELGFKGYFTNGAKHSLETSEIHIMNLNARPGKGVFKGNFVVRDFTKPHTLVQVRSELELRFLGDFLGIHDLKQITGKIKLNMDFKELTDINLPEESLHKLKEGIQSTLAVENLSFRIPGYPHEIDSMNLHAKMEDGRITIDSGSVRIGKSDLRFKGSLSDIRAFLRHHDKPVKLQLTARSKRLILPELLSFDTALAKKINEEITGFNIGLSLETSVNELLNPAPLPRGTLEMTSLNAAFKVYPHQLKDLSATVIINDTTLRLRNLVGSIDSSDFHFSGRVNNYGLWFKDVKKGKTQIAFDFKSKHFALRDVFTREIRQYLPRGYRREILNNAWLRTKIDLRYDTTFRFAKAKIANVTGELVRHRLKLEGISGHVKYGARVLILDTLRGKIGRSDFDVTFKWFNGPDRNMKKRTNYLKFTSKFLDVDEISQYDLAPKTGPYKKRGDTLSTNETLTTNSQPVTTVAAIDSTKHKDAFNMFMIPFSDFNGEISIGKVKYNHLWLRDVRAVIRMEENQHLYVDTLRMNVAGGTLKMRGHFNGTDPQKIYFRSRIYVDQVDLEKMMLKLDHFGQDVIINKNIKGKLSGEIKSYVQVHPNFVPIMSKTKAELNVTIFNGTLVDFAPMQAMASYFKDKNLRLIRFDTLQNKLTFTNGVLDIPSMDINSSIGSIRMSGKQTLDLSMEYYLRVPMKMVTKVGFTSLFNKKQEDVDLTQVDEIEYLDKEKKMAFMNLKLVGTPDDFKVGLGRDRNKK